jgi:hypothetical protein
LGGTSSFLIGKQKMKKQSKQSEPAGQWIRQNWFNLVTLAMALIALTLSLQANQTSNEANEIANEANEIARENSSPQMSVVKEGFLKDTVMVTGCRTETNYFYLEFYAVDEFTIANRGGRTTALVGAQLKQGERQYDVRVYSPQAFNANEYTDLTRGVVVGEPDLAIMVPTKADPLTLPLNIESGTGSKWMFQGEFIRVFSTQQEAQSALDSEENAPRELTWSFEFSDGSIVTLNKEIVSYSINPNLDYSRLVCEEK